MTSYQNKSDDYVFISYRRTDFDWVKTYLLPKLEVWKVNYVIDHQDFLPGQRVASTIRDYIRSSQKVIFVCTREFLDSEWCREELETARTEDPGSIQGKSIPVVLDKRGVPDLLSDIIWCDLSNDQNDANEWRKLCVSIGGSWYDYSDIQDLVKAAIGAEYAVYKQLPKIKLKKLENYFDVNGGAYKRINNLLVQHSQKNWIISNKNNPSNYLILDIQVKPDGGDGYIAETKEYWYLRWYSLRDQKYRHIYDETNEQLYKVRNLNGSYKVVDNIYPAPRKRWWRSILNYILKSR